MSNKVLIVIDMQNDFVYDALGSADAQAIVPAVKRKIDECLARGDRVIFTRDTHHSDYMVTHEGRNLPVPHCIEGTPGWQVIGEIDRPECLHIDKPCFGYTGWAGVLENSSEIELIGVCTDICVVSNALILRALFPEIEITADAACCAGTSSENHAAALQVMKCCQIRVTGA